MKACIVMFVCVQMFFVQNLFAQEDVKVGDVLAALKASPSRQDTIVEVGEFRFRVDERGVVENCENKLIKTYVPKATRCSLKESHVFRDSVLRKVFSERDCKLLARQGFGMEVLLDSTGCVREVRFLLMDKAPDVTLGEIAGIEQRFTREIRCEFLVLEPSGVEYVTFVVPCFFRMVYDNPDFTISDYRKGILNAPMKEGDSLMGRGR